MALITDALPAALRTRLENYCRITGDEPGDVVHDAMALFSERRADAVVTGDELVRHAVADLLEEQEPRADAVAADPLLQDGDALARAVAQAMSS